MMSLRIDEAPKDRAGSIDHLKQEKGVTGSKVGTVGCCMGGALSLFAASQNPEGGACLVFDGGHPNVKPDLRKRRRRLGLSAGKDEFVTAQAVDELDKQLTATGLSWLLVCSEVCSYGTNATRTPAVYSGGRARLRIMTPAQILLVEDDDHARELFASALRLTGYHVRTASDGLAGLRVLEAFDPDVVIVDLSLPIASGFDVLNELRAAPRTQHTPVIAISGHASDLKQARSNPEFFATIQKPCDPETLVRVVDRARRYSYI